jgi:peptide/nickel transport system permease protein
MTVGAVAVMISTIIGLLVGLTSGFYGGWIDNILMRFTEVINSFPFLPMAITLSSFVGGILTQTERLLLIMVILGVISWTGLARLVRGQILAEREKDFVLAARALGIRSKVIILRHILPNVINVVIVSMTLGYAGSLLTEAGLSFLGFGVIPPSPSWGNMLTGAQDSTVITFYWWRWILPAVAVLITALTVNIVGDGLRDAMDPKNNEK